MLQQSLSGAGVPSTTCLRSPLESPQNRFQYQQKKKNLSHKVSGFAIEDEGKHPQSKSFLLPPENVDQI